MAAPSGDDGTITWAQVLRETTAATGDAVHARWMCETASGADGVEFDAVLAVPVTERALARLDAMVARYRAGEPVQYVLGSWGFRRLDLVVDPRVLIPRPETELVAGLAIELAVEAGPIRHVADLGTGSGAIGLALADELPSDGTFIWMTDDSESALDVARANLAAIGRNARNVRIGQGRWFEALPADARFDVIASNPPYVAEGSADVEAIVAGWEPEHALFAGPDGLDDLRHLVAGASRWLRPGGALVLEIGADQGAAVRRLLEAGGYTEVEIRPDLAGRDRIAVGRCPVRILEAGDLVLRHLRNRVADYALLLGWLTDPAVLEWYEGRDQQFDLARILAEYGPGGELEREGTTATIVELAGRPAGFVQCYELAPWAEEFGLADGRGVWSLDLYLDPQFHGSGLGRRVVRAVAEHLAGPVGAREVVIMPYTDNVRAIRAYEAAGFVGVEVVPDHELHEGELHDGLRMHFRP
jgi:release factor glutamine methyltransferase